MATNPFPREVFLTHDQLAMAPPPRTLVRRLWDARGDWGYFAMMLPGLAVGAAIVHYARRRGH